MATIVAITTKDIWNDAKQKGLYTKSTIETELKDIGFIHCTSPDQTIATANRHFDSRDELLLLLIDTNRVNAVVKFEASLSGGPGLFPHIYGPLNIDAVYDVLRIEKNKEGQFIDPKTLRELYP